MEKLKMQSHDVIGSNIQKIAQLFPNCVTERLGKDGKPELAIDFEKLQAELSNEIIAEGEERYQFTWPDKRAVVRLANTPTTMTLRPCREESVDFDNTQNLYIEGDNLDVLKVLRETYLGKVKMIYIDPPYNTGKDFVYNDDFAESYSDFAESCKVYDEDGNLQFDPKANGESNGRFHTDWLNMIYPRLKIAKDLLTEDGAILISIDDNEVENLRKVCDEIFGVQNFVAQMIWQQGKKSSGNLMVVNHEYVIVYVKNHTISDTNENSWKQRKEGLDKIYNQYEALKRIYGNDHSKIQVEIRKFFASLPENDPAYNSKHYNYVDEKGLFFADNSCAPDRPESRCHKPLIHPITKKETAVPSLGWRWKEETLDKLVEEGRIYFGSDETSVPKVKKYLKEMEYELPSTVFYKDGRGASKRLESLLDGKLFDFPKDENVIESFVNMITSNDDSTTILDFFSGSATTAHAVMKLNAEDGGNRKFIMVQLPEKTDEKSEAYKAGYKNICEIGKERIRRAGKKIKEEAGLSAQNLDTGFRVLKLDSSNMEDVYYTPREFELQSLFNENVKADRTNEDLLFQVMLDLGIELSAKIESKQIAGKNVHLVDDNYLVACFDRDVNESTITEIAKLQPIYFVMRDASAANDNVIDNFEQIFKHYSPDTNCRII